ncbi:TIGR02186 family protein [Tabrizicola sp. J26]|uniref:TIGR02186 family protein n=1 Tax=Alitabrizicola rongguiensis TaxID=2909234 RepID=UPI001F2B8090|nr:TIGR02186 family protein [Tabrizicola rongguiensis]MCF1709171.1 TIGR02186 family protein [Tabrizicola rongguiensis]
MRLRPLLLALALIAPLPSNAQGDGETVVAGLSQNEVSITARFSGSEIMVYGAVKRDAPPPASPALDVIVTVEGPLTPVVVRKKNRRYGLWINTESVEIDAAPSFYAVATTGLLRDVLSDTDDLRYKVTIPRAIRAVGIAGEAEDASSFTDALIRVRAEQGAYILNQNAVSLTQETLIRTDVALPANLIEGIYKVRIFLTRGGRVIDVSENEIDVRKEGLERWLTNLAHNQPLAYGLLSLAIAALAGWAASEAFRVRRT